MVIGMMKEGEEEERRKMDNDGRKGNRRDERGM